MNKEVYKYHILSINHKTKGGSVAVSLVKSCNMAQYPEGDFRLAWDCLMAKYASRTAILLLKLTKKFPTPNGVALRSILVNGSQNLRV